jgi:hypothetical protein
MANYQQIKEIDIKSLNRQDLGNNLKFEEIIPNLEKIKEYLLFFENKEHFLTNVDIDSINYIYNGFFDSILSIKSFKVNSNESHEQAQIRRNVILEKIHTLHKISNEKILPLLTYLKFDDTRIQENISNIQNKLVQIDNQFNSRLQNFDNNANGKIAEVNTRIEDASKLITEINQIKNNITNFSVEQLVERYGTIFKTQADKNKKIAIVSLFIFIIFLFTLIQLTVNLFSPFIDRLINVNSNNITIFRLTLLGMCFLFVKESLKNFNINMHLYNLNLHRQNALLSFQTLIVNAQNYETKDYIIKEIAQTIYSNQDDGYLRSDKRMINLSQITELIKILK